MTSKELQTVPSAKTYIHANATPSYYPDAKDMVVEIAYDTTSGKLLGAEVFGQYGVDKRIDVFATCLYAGLKVEDLPNLDLAYAPPFSPAKDPVVVAGYVAGNHRRHQCSPLSAAELSTALAVPNHAIQLLDVRTADEIRRHGTIHGSVQIELDELRDHLTELDPARPVYLYCARGIRGYLAALILKQRGFENVRNLAGGFKAWDMQGFPIEKVAQGAAA